MKTAIKTDEQNTPKKQIPRTETLTLRLTIREKQMIKTIVEMMGDSIENTILWCLYYCVAESGEKVK